MLKLQRQKFQSAIIERYSRRESGVEKALIEKRRRHVGAWVEDITEALWGHRINLGTVSSLSKKINEWRHRRIEGEHPYISPPLWQTIATCRPAHRSHKERHREQPGRSN